MHKPCKKQNWNVRVRFFENITGNGAVVLQNDIVVAAGCTLPMSSSSTFEKTTLGMRHRAGVGITEQSDVLSLIVSEETGSISVAEDGKLTRGLSRESLRKLLTKKMEPEKPKSIKGFFDFFPFHRNN